MFSKLFGKKSTGEQGKAENPKKEEKVKIDFVSGMLKGAKDWPNDKRYLTYSLTVQLIRDLTAYIKVVDKWPKSFDKWAGLSTKFANKMIDLLRLYGGMLIKLLDVGLLDKNSSFYKELIKCLEEIKHKCGESKYTVITSKNFENYPNIVKSDETMLIGDAANILAILADHTEELLKQSKTVISFNNKIFTNDNGLMLIYNDPQIAKRIKKELSEVCKSSILSYIRNKFGRSDEHSKKPTIVQPELPVLDVPDAKVAAPQKEKTQENPLQKVKSEKELTAECNNMRKNLFKMANEAISIRNTAKKQMDKFAAAVKGENFSSTAYNEKGSYTEAEQEIKMAWSMLNGSYEELSKHNYTFKVTVGEVSPDVTIIYDNKVNPVAFNYLDGDIKNLSNIYYAANAFKVVTEYCSERLSEMREQAKTINQKVKALIERYEPVSKAIDKRRAELSKILQEIIGVQNSAHDDLAKTKEYFAEFEKALSAKEKKEFAAQYEKIISDFGMSLTHDHYLLVCNYGSKTDESKEEGLIDTTANPNKITNIMNSLSAEELNDAISYCSKELGEMKKISKDLSKRENDLKKKFGGKIDELEKARKKATEMLTDARKLYETAERIKNDAAVYAPDRRTGYKSADYPELMELYGMFERYFERVYAVLETINGYGVDIFDTSDDIKKLKLDTMQKFIKESPAILKEFKELNKKLNECLKKMQKEAETKGGQYKDKAFELEGILNEIIKAKDAALENIENAQTRFGSVCAVMTDGQQKEALEKYILELEDYKTTIKINYEVACGFDYKTTKEGAYNKTFGFIYSENNEDKVNFQTIEALDMKIMKQAIARCSGQLDTIKKVSKNIDAHIKDMEKQFGKTASEIEKARDAAAKIAGKARGLYEGEIYNVWKKAEEFFRPFKNTDLEKLKKLYDTCSNIFDRANECYGEWLQYINKSRKSDYRLLEQGASMDYEQSARYEIYPVGESEARDALVIGNHRIKDLQSLRSFVKRGNDCLANLEKYSKNIKPEFDKIKKAGDAKLAELRDEMKRSLQGVVNIWSEATNLANPLSQPEIDHVFEYLSRDTSTVEFSNSVAQLGERGYLSVPEQEDGSKLPTIREDFIDKLDAEKLLNDTDICKKLCDDAMKKGKEYIANMKIYIEHVKETTDLMETIRAKVQKFIEQWERVVKEIGNISVSESRGLINQKKNIFNTFAGACSSCIKSVDREKCEYEQSTLDEMRKLGYVVLTDISEKKLSDGALKGLTDDVKDFVSRMKVYKGLLDFNKEAKAIFDDASEKMKKIIEDQKLKNLLEEYGGVSLSYVLPSELRESFTNVRKALDECTGIYGNGTEPSIKEVFTDYRKAEINADWIDSLAFNQQNISDQGAALTTQFNEIFKKLTAAKEAFDKAAKGVVNKISEVLKEEKKAKDNYEKIDGERREIARLMQKYTDKINEAQDIDPRKIDGLYNKLMVEYSQIMHGSGRIEFAQTFLALADEKRETMLDKVKLQQFSKLAPKILKEYQSFHKKFNDWLEKEAPKYLDNAIPANLTDEKAQKILAELDKLNQTIQDKKTKFDNYATALDSVLKTIGSQGYFKTIEDASDALREAREKCKKDFDPYREEFEFWKNVYGKDRAKQTEPLNNPEEFLQLFESKKSPYTVMNETLDSQYEQLKSIDAKIKQICGGIADKWKEHIEELSKRVDKILSLYDQRVNKTGFKGTIFDAEINVRTVREAKEKYQELYSALRKPIESLPILKDNKLEEVQKRADEFAEWCNSMVSSYSSIKKEDSLREYEGNAVQDLLREVNWDVEGAYSSYSQLDAVEKRLGGDKAIYGYLNELLLPGGSRDHKYLANLKKEIQELRTKIKGQRAKISDSGLAPPKPLEEFEKLRKDCQRFYGLVKEYEDIISRLKILKEISDSSNISDELTKMRMEVMNSQNSVNFSNEEFESSSKSVESFKLDAKLKAEQEKNLREVTKAKKAYDTLCQKIKDMKIPDKITKEFKISFVDLKREYDKEFERLKDEYKRAMEDYNKWAQNLGILLGENINKNLKIMDNLISGYNQTKQSLAKGPREALKDKIAAADEAIAGYKKLREEFFADPKLGKPDFNDRYNKFVESVERCEIPVKAFLSEAGKLKSQGQKKAAEEPKPQKKNKR